MTDVMTHMQEDLERALKEIPRHIGISGGNPGPAMCADGKLHEALFYLNAELVLTKLRRLMDVIGFNEYDIVNTAKDAAPLNLNDIKRNMYEGEYLIWYLPPRTSLDTPSWSFLVRSMRVFHKGEHDKVQGIAEVKKLLAESGLLDGWDGPNDDFTEAFTCIGSVNVF
jgi:hypothetical protein